MSNEKWLEFTGHRQVENYVQQEGPEFVKARRRLDEWTKRPKLQYLYEGKWIDAWDWHTSRVFDGLHGASNPGNPDWKGLVFGEFTAKVMRPEDSKNRIPAYLETWYTDGSEIEPFFK